MAKIVVIDDVSQNPYLLTGLLTEKGHQTTVATNQQRASLIVGQEEPDVIIAFDDQQNPLCSYLERLVNDGLMIPVIVVVTDCNLVQAQAVVKTYVDSGFIALTKSDDFEPLLEEVTRALNGNSA